MSSKEFSIRVEGLSKRYEIYSQPVDRLKQMILPRVRRWAHRSDRAYFTEFWALHDVSFDVKRGETIGIVGRNGSGKSTLLQLVCGTLTPTLGRVTVHGRVAALLELGSGFNAEFTGRENVYMNASILGLTKAEIDSRYAAILAFADIGDFIDQPVKNYSSGMTMRLAFSVMAHVDADILIVDEALAVGDAFFTQKCMRFLREFKQHGTLLFVSHDSSAVTGLCDRAIWIEHGRLQLLGTAKDVTNAYLEAFMADRQGGNARKEEHIKVANVKRRNVDPRRQLFDRSNLRNDIKVLPFNPDQPTFGELSARVVDIAFLDESGEPVSWIAGGETVQLEITGMADIAVDNLIVGFYIKDKLGQLLFGDNTYLTTLERGFSASEGEMFRVKFLFEMPRLQHGDYFVTVGVASGTQETHVVQAWLHEALMFKSNGPSVPAGILGIPMHAISVERV
ncbi:MAG: ABC transporter ATP-binding protein [Rhodanobacteraceae bacterium]